MGIAGFPKRYWKDESEKLKLKGSEADEADEGEG